MKVQEKRFDEEAAERKRLKDEQEADLQRVKNQSEAAIHAAEDAARKKMNPNGAAPPKAEVWYEETERGPQRAGRVSTVGLPQTSGRAW